MSDALLVFLKEPVPGQVKTRLAAALGPEAAAALYGALVEHVLAATRGPWRRLLFAAPAAAAPRLAARYGEDVQAQSEGDLGLRMATAFATAFARGARRAVIVGTDCPSLAAATVGAAFAALVDHDVAIAPARDGGYVMLGVRAPCPELFAGVEWSTPRVTAQTLERAAAAGLRVRSLAPHGDLDTVEDLAREREGLMALALDAPTRAAIARALAELMPSRTPERPTPR